MPEPNKTNVSHEDTLKNVYEGKYKGWSVDRINEEIDEIEGRSLRGILKRAWEFVKNVGRLIWTPIQGLVLGRAAMERRLNDQERAETVAAKEKEAKLEVLYGMLEKTQGREENQKDGQNKDGPEQPGKNQPNQPKKEPKQEPDHEEPVNEENKQPDGPKQETSVPEKDEIWFSWLNQEKAAKYINSEKTESGKTKWTNLTSFLFRDYDKHDKQIPQDFQFGLSEYLSAVSGISGCVFAKSDQNIFFLSQNSNQDVLLSVPINGNEMREINLTAFVNGKYDIEGSENRSDASRRVLSAAELAYARETMRFVAMYAEHLRDHYGIKKIEHGISRSNYIKGNELGKVGQRVKAIREAVEGIKCPDGTVITASRNADGYQLKVETDKCVTTSAYPFSIETNAYKDIKDAIYSAAKEHGMTFHKQDKSVDNLLEGSKPITFCGYHAYIGYEKGEDGNGIFTLTMKDYVDGKDVSLGDSYVATFSGDDKKVGEEIAKQLNAWYGELLVERNPDRINSLFERNSDMRREEISDLLEHIKESGGSIDDYDKMCARILMSAAAHEAELNGAGMPDSVVQLGQALGGRPNERETPETAVDGHRQDQVLNPEEVIENTTDSMPLQDELSEQPDTEIPGIGEEDKTPDEESKDEDQEL